MTTPTRIQKEAITIIPAEELKDLTARVGDALVRFGEGPLYACLVTDMHGGFNVAISSLRDSEKGEEYVPEIYLFPQMVTEGKARKKYSELR